jgi:hypothetical protein
MDGPREKKAWNERPRGEKEEAHRKKRIGKKR